MFPAFLNLDGRAVVVVGGGPVAASKLESLLAAGARVTVVAPDVGPRSSAWASTIVRREFAAARSRRRLVGRGGGDAGGQPPGAWRRPRRGGCSSTPWTIRARVGVSGRRRPARRRDDGDLDRRPRARAGRLAARGARRVAAARARRSGSTPRTRRGATGARNGVPMDERRPLLLEALNRLVRAPSPSPRGNSGRASDLAAGRCRSSAPVRAIPSC